ncbi:MAG: hypothetical protein ABSF43_14890 [Rectinemataceae bacterium]|jgi:hypothetical protein
MTIKERFEAMRKAGMEIQRPMELFAELDEKGMMGHLDAKAAVFSEGAVPSKYKVLARISHIN